jgi:hypothetical protein
MHNEGSKVELLVEKSIRQSGEKSKSVMFKGN